MQLIEDASREKLLGAYYTPTKIAQFILRWGMDKSEDCDILEPSCGDGAFLRCIAAGSKLYRSVTAIEIEKEEADKAEAVSLPRATVLNMDFHRFCLDTGRRFDLIVGNPPFIRYQYYDAGQQLLADEIFKKSGLQRTRLTNAWVTFVVGCTQLLKDRGYMGLVVPSELLQVKYARQLRKFLAQEFNKITIISFMNLVFEEIQQEIVLLLCEKNATAGHFIEHLEVKDVEGLNTIEPCKLDLPSKKIDFHTDKWTYYFLNQKELDFLQKIKSSNMPQIKSFADVEVGITTGANNYFTVTQSIVKMYNLESYARPMVGRSVQVSGASFTHEDWIINSLTGAKTNLLVFTPDAMASGNSGTKTYLANGETRGIHKGYKTGIRDEWYVIPSIKLSDALFLRRNNLFPKFVLNETQAYTTDTMHRVFIHQGVNKRAFVASYYNSLSFTFSEILGRNFGGGCLELMPSEVEEIYIPYNEENEKIFSTIDTMLRQKKSADEILDYTDHIILCQGMGFTVEEAALARSIWHKIIGRRLGREALEKGKKGKPAQVIPTKIKQLNFLDTLLQYPDNIVENQGVHTIHDSARHIKDIDFSKNALICLVKDDNMKQFLNNTARFYYTGKKFPASVALDRLYYFIPYIKRKGIRDLYLIKVARIGTKKEFQPECEDIDYRLVFEIEFVEQMLDSFTPIHLDIWRTFTDTTLSDLKNKIQSFS